MEQKKIYVLTSVLLVTIFLAACSSPSIPPTQPQLTATAQAPATEPATQPATPEATTPLPQADLCANTYYPVRQGATWNYKSTGGPGGEYTFTDAITSVREDGFTLSTEMGGRTHTQEWTCSAEGLTALQLGGAPAAMVTAQNMELNLDVTNGSGVSFPRQIHPGDSWQQIMDVEGDITFMNEEATATGSGQMVFKAIGTESVTVPAGTFEALRVDVDITLNINASYEGITLPVSFSGDYTYWFAPGVGWVRAAGTGSFLGNSFSETTELQSYTIP